MDTEKLIAHSRARFNHEISKQTLKEKYQAKMLFAYRGGMWRAGPELNTMISTCGQTGEIVLLDLYETPVKINSQELLSLSQQRWHEQMTAWHIEYDELGKKR